MAHQNLTNAEKSSHGQSAQNSIDFILNRCLDSGYLKSIKSDYRIGKPGYRNTTQFYSPFMIEFEDSTKWAIFSTTSFRNDRFKGQLWDAVNLKEIDPSITKAYLVYPDGLPDDIRSTFESKQAQCLDNSNYFSIDGIIPQDILSNMIEDYALSDVSDGSRSGKQGNQFEAKVASILSYEQNLNKWKFNSATTEGMHYDMFCLIVDCFELSKANVKSISATSDKKKIGLLPSGGPAKTDVLVEITLNDDSVEYYTISCKRTGAKAVTVHDYTAEQFSQTLNPSDYELKNLLIDFQNAGSLSSMGEEKCSLLEQHLAPYVDKLALWVLGGIDGIGDPQTQWAEYILTYDNLDNSASIHRITEYYKLLQQKGTTRNFGTPFGWTYPSKKRGQRIQLKCKIIK